MIPLSPRPKLRLITVLLMSSGLLLASQASLLSGAVAAKPTTCAELHRWAEVYRGKSITLEELSAFDRPHRVAIFNAVSPEIRSALWIEQLRRFNGRPDLSLDQRALVREGATLLTPATYEHDAASARTFRAFWTRASSAFPVSEHRRAWFDLGAVVVGNEPNRSSSMRPTLGAGPAIGQTVGCECNHVAQDCFASTCFVRGCVQSIGCGPGGAYLCDGVCES